MKRFTTLFAITVALASAAGDALACATCFGAPDTNSTRAANLFMAVLLGITGFVLGCLVTFMIYLRRREARCQRDAAIWQSALRHLEAAEEEVETARRFGGGESGELAPSRLRGAEKRAAYSRRRFHLPD